MSKQKLLLHICCAPDEAYVVHTLHQEYELTCFFCNPNIFPHDEYHLRLNEAKKTANIYSVPFFADEFRPETWEAAIKDFENTLEGGERCCRCFMLRLRQTAAFCAKAGLPAFTTVMSVSPHKNITMLGECGAKAAEEFGVRYMPFDFKKRDGFRKSVLLSNELGLYRQNYCGCRLSLAEAEARKQKKMANQGPVV
jgi:epoxyqueuosine reductase